MIEPVPPTVMDTDLRGAKAPRTHFGPTQVTLVFPMSQNKSGLYPMPYRKVPARLRELRLKKSVTQRALAKQLGVSQQQVQQYENGSSMMTAKHIAVACQTLGVSPNELFAWDGDHKLTPQDVAGIVDYINTTLDADLRQATLEWWDTFTRFVARNRRAR